MHIEQFRFKKTDKVTIGTINFDDGVSMYSLEDPIRKEKIYGETAISAGTYEIKFREVLSPKTEKYRSRFEWFTWHLELQDVPNFTYVYVHIGNDVDDTDACVLTGSDANLQTDRLINSTDAYEEFYLKVSKALNSGEKVFIEIK